MSPSMRPLVLLVGLVACSSSGGAPHPVSDPLPDLFRLDTSAFDFVMSSDDRGRSDLTGARDRGLLSPDPGGGLLSDPGGRDAEPVAQDPGPGSGDRGAEISDPGAGTPDPGSAPDPGQAVDPGAIVDPGSTPDPGPIAACTALGQPCDPANPATGSFICVRTSPGAGLCRARCTVPAQGQASGCGASEACLGAAVGGEGFCAPATCGGFYTNECGAGAKCLGFEDGTGVCILGGLGQGGTPCTLQSDCGDGFLCIDSTCTAPECVVVGAGPGCPEGSECEAYGSAIQNLQVGSCLAQCEVFTPGSCASGTWCSVRERDPQSGLLTGLCVDSLGGQVNQGGACGAGTPAPTNTCADGLLCLSDSTESTCYSVCDPDFVTTGQGPCGAGLECNQLFTTTPEGGLDTVLPFGVCEVGCDPFQDPSGCAAGAWCAPSLFNIRLGTCVPDDGLAPLGQACGADATPGQRCRAGLTCAGGICREVCDPDATTGAGTCPTLTFCGGLVIPDAQGVDQQLAFGACQPGCDFHSHVSCADTAQVCIMAEIFDEPNDLCIDPPATAAWGLPEQAICPAGTQVGALCGPNSVCLDDGTNLRCFDVCATSAGPFGSVHPDCRVPGRTCEQVFTDSTVIGVCL